jgi:hypothetical protein
MIRHVSPPVFVCLQTRFENTYRCRRLSRSPVLWISSCVSFYASCPNYATRFLALSSGIRYRYRIAKSDVRSPGTRIHRNTGIVWLMSAAVSCCLRETAATLQSLNGTRMPRPRPERRAHANRGNCGCFCRRVRGANPGTRASAGPARAERGLAGGPDRTGIAGCAVRIVASARRRPGAEHHDCAGDPRHSASRSTRSSPMPERPGHRPSMWGRYPAIPGPRLGVRSPRGNAAR